MTTTAEIKEPAGQLAELLKLTQAGQEVLLTLGNKPIARLTPAVTAKVTDTTIHIRSFTGHRVLTPVIAQAELADEMFARP